MLGPPSTLTDDSNNIMGRRQEAHEPQAFGSHKEWNGNECVWSTVYRIGSRRFKWNGAGNSWVGRASPPHPLWNVVFVRSTAFLKWISPRRRASLMKCILPGHPISYGTRKNMNPSITVYNACEQTGIYPTRPQTGIYNAGEKSDVYVPVSVISETPFVVKRR